jgi:hypothetical protein
MEFSETIQDWLGTFWRILISPVPKTFVEEAEKAHDKFASAIGWAVFLAIYSYLVPILAGYTFNFTVFVLLLLILPLVVVLVPSTAHFMLVRVFHRKEYLYDKILYIFTAILVVFQLITNLTFFVPAKIAPVLNSLLIAYTAVLLIIAISAIAKIKYWQAVIVTFSSVVAGAFIFMCTLPLVTSLMGGVIRTMR